MSRLASFFALLHTSLPLSNALTLHNTPRQNVA